MKSKLQKSMKLRQKVKLIFEYPNSKKAVIRRGFVKETRETSFDFIEVKDGQVTYSYKYLIEIKDI